MKLEEIQRNSKNWREEEINNTEEKQKQNMKS